MTNEAGRMLNRAALAAWRAAGDVEPNPMVGAVIVRDGVVIGVGHHRRFGGLHAEREALESCRRQGQDPRGATMYVTLEPCNGAGKQPACVDAVIAAGIRRVVFAARDPSPGKAGGAERLRGAGVEAEFTDASPCAALLSAPFRKRVLTGLPWVVAKWAQTLDGKVATRAGESKWISGEASRRRVHRLRARVDAIVTGMGTVVADDPMLTARGVRRVRRTAARVVVDSGLELSPGSALARTARDVRTLVVCSARVTTEVLGRERADRLRATGVDVETVAEGERGLDLRAMLAMLADRHGVGTVMIEAGPRLIGVMLGADLVDQAVVYVAPMTLGDREGRGAIDAGSVERLADCSRWTLLRHRRSGGDLELVYGRPERGDTVLR